MIRATRLMTDCMHPYIGPGGGGGGGVIGQIAVLTGLYYVRLQV